MGSSLVGDLPPYWRLSERSFIGGLTAGREGHCWESSQDLSGFSPDGNFLHGVVIGDVSLVEAVGDGKRGEAFDAGNVAVAVAKSRGEACSRCSGSITACMNAHLFRLI